MSRVYRIKVRESLRRVLRASDHVRTELEMLEILPPEQMAQLLAEELAQRGFEKKGKTLVRRDQGVIIEVEPATGTVTVKAEAEEKLDLEVSRDVIGDADLGRALKKETRDEAKKKLQSDLEKTAAKKSEQLQRQVTERLEGKLHDLRQELDQAVNRVTAEALKRKAAQMGQIKEMTEDPQSGSLTIVLEV
jgi:hypothetical protein